MLISFLGAPCSGKTTIAAKVFAHLKEAGVNCEISTEEARFYFAERRLLDLPVSLTDQDQIAIMTRQLHRDASFLFGNPGVVISDSSPINALLYMNKIDSKAIELAQKAATQTSILFYTPPIKNYTQEINRVHSQEESLKADSAIQGIIRTHVPEVLPKLIRLDGNIDTRTTEALHKIYGGM